MELQGALLGQHQRADDLLAGHLELDLEVGPDRQVEPAQVDPVGLRVAVGGVPRTGLAARTLGRGGRLLTRGGLGRLVGRGLGRATSASEHLVHLSYLPVEPKPPAPRAEPGSRSTS